MRLPNGMLLDLDDTIIAFDAVSEPVWESLCSRYAPHVGGCDPSRLLNAVHRARKWYWSEETRHQQGRLDLEQARREIVRSAFDHLGFDDTFVADEIADTYSIERDDAVQLFPGAKETLQALFNLGVRLVLITNGSAKHQWRKIKRFKLEKYFETILIEGELGYGKPDLRVYRRALDGLGLKPSEVWIVGDNLEWEVAAPQRLGIYSIWHDYKAQGLPAGSSVVPDRVINRISELVEPV